MLREPIPRDKGEQLPIVATFAAHCRGLCAEIRQAAGSCVHCEFAVCIPSLSCIAKLLLERRIAKHPWLWTCNGYGVAARQRANFITVCLASCSLDRDVTPEKAQISRSCTVARTLYSAWRYAEPTLYIGHACGDIEALGR
jgi:hypothetical protein